MVMPANVHDDPYAAGWERGYEAALNALGRDVQQHPDAPLTGLLAAARVRLAEDLDQ